MTDAKETNEQNESAETNEGSRSDLFKQLARFVVREQLWVLVILLAHLPLILNHFRNLWYRPQYQHFPLILLAIWMLFFSRIHLREGPGPTSNKPTSLAITAWAFALLIFAVGTIFFSPWFSAVSFWLAFGGVILVLQNRFRIEMAWGIWLICALLIPIPGNYEVPVSQYLQRSTAQTSGMLLAAMKITNDVQGTTLMLPAGRLFVEEACSGIVSMMSILATCLVLAVAWKRSILHTALLVISGLLWAATTNVIRILAIALAQERMALDLTSGWEHTALGMSIYIVAFLLILSTDQWLFFLFDPGVYADGDNKIESSSSVKLWKSITSFGTPACLKVSDTGDSESSDPTSDSDPSHGPSETEDGSWVRGLLTPSIAIGFAVFAMIGVQKSFSHANTGYLNLPMWNSSIAQELDVHSLPESVGDWKRTGFSETRDERLFAQDSRIWEYQNGDATAVFSLDYAFPRWHDLCQCYESIGWSKVGASEFELLGTEPFVRAHFNSDARRTSELYFSLCDTKSNFIEPLDALPPVEFLLQRVSPDRTLLQVQLWVTRDHSASDEDSQSDESLFLSLREELLIQIANRPSQKSASESSGASEFAEGSK